MIRWLFGAALICGLVPLISGLKYEASKKSPFVLGCICMMYILYWKKDLISQQNRITKWLKLLQLFLQQCHCSDFHCNTASIKISFEGCDSTRIEYCDTCHDPSPMCIDNMCTGNTILSRDKDKCMGNFTI